MKAKEKKIGRLAEAKLRVLKATQAVASASAAHLMAYRVFKGFCDSYSVKYDSSGFPQDQVGFKRESFYLADKVGQAQRILYQVLQDLRDAEMHLSEVLELMRPGDATVTATSRNRVPFISSISGGMEEWDLLQEKMSPSDDNRSKCQCCRREKARRNPNSKPSKARK